VKVEIEWHLASRSLPKEKRDVLFHVRDSGDGSFWVGQFSGGIFSSTEHDFAASEVWCWAYLPEIPT